MSSNNNPPSSVGEVSAETEDRLTRYVQARYAENTKITLEMVTEIIGDDDPVAKQDWDQTAEDRMEQRWEESKRKESSDKLGTRGNNDDPLREVWRYCLRFMKQAPPIMLSPVNSLQFLAGKQMETTNHLFSIPACQLMSKLFVHPLWRGDYRLFVDALIFAAFCRVGGKANIDLSFRRPPGCPVIRALNAKLREASDAEKPLPHTLQKLHRAVRDTVKGNRGNESLFSEALYNIGKLATPDEIPTPTEMKQLRQGIVTFQVQDLGVMKKALDNMASSDRFQGSVEEIYVAFRSLGQRGQIPSRKQLRGLDARACQQVLRMCDRPERFGSLSLPPDWLSDQGAPASRTAGDQGRDRSRSPLAQRLDSYTIRSRSRLRSPDTYESDRDFSPAEPCRTLLPDDEDNGYLSDEGGMSAASDDSQHATKSDRLSVGNIDESILLIVEAILQRHRPATPDMITDILQDGDSLMNEDEDGIQAKWQRSERKKSSDQIGTRSTDDDPLRDLWHVCIRFLKQTPPVLFSPFNRLQFVPEIEDDSAVFSCHLLSEEACHAIADLIVHPVWQQDHRYFINVLLYTANLRVGGKINFRWLPLPHVDCPVLQALNARLQSMEDEQLPQTIHQLHRQVDVAAIEDRHEPSFFSDLMISISGFVNVEKSPTMRELELLRHNIIPFRITDLECIQKVLDAFAYSDERVGVGLYVKDVADALKVLRKDEEPTEDQLRELDARACKRMLRMVARPDIYASQSEQLARTTAARRSCSPRPSPESRSGAVRCRSPVRQPPTLLRPLNPISVPPASSSQVTPSRPTEMSHWGMQHEHNPLREEPESTRPSSTQGGQNRAPSHATVQDRLLEELRASFESQKTDLRKLSRKVEEQGSLIKALQEDNRILKQKLDQYPPRQD
ncbi:hypothetical protein F52700_2469 [Fusarium sp. NRRL 52700]|nr:hypothetical protein F52700_2469 [Fusarium sp. NRRL 52700]